jgi:hypothetical protein
MSVAAEVHEKLDINRVVRGSLEVLQRNWRSLIRPALLFLYLPGVLAGLFRPHPVPGGGVTGAPVLAFLASILEIVLYALFQGAVFRLAVADLHAEPISTADAVRVGRERMWAMLGLTLLAGFGIALGLVLLIVPGVLLALAWTVVGPVLIEERRPIMETFGRSAELTRRSRLNIFGVGLLVLLLEIVAAGVVGLVSAPFPQRLAEALLWPLYSSGVAVVNGVVIAVVYDELRTLSARRLGAMPSGAAA